MSIDVNVQNDLVIVTESSEDITVNVSNAAGPQGPAGVGVPVGGTTGQVLKKQSGTDYDTFWALDGVGVPYSGATGNVDLGDNDLEAGSVFVEGAAGAGGALRIKQFGSSAANLDGYSTISTLSTGVFYFTAATTAPNFKNFVLNPSGITDNILRTYTLPNLDGTLALLSDIPSLTGFVPYTGATTNVDLGTHRILAQNATIASSGSGDTVTLTHSSGSGIGLNITKGGSGEGLYINKTSGSGNAATIIGTLNATTLVKSGGTSSQFLKADGSVDSTTYVGGSGTSGQVAYWNGTSSQTGSNNLFWDAANSRLGIGTNTPSASLHIVKSTVNDALLVVTPNNNSTLFPFFLGGATLTSDTYLRANAGILEFSRVGNPSTIRTVGGGTNNLVLQSNDNLIFNSNGANERARFFSGGNFGIGTGTTDSGQRLQVIGDAFIRGSGATSATTGLQVQNSAGNNMFRIANNGAISLGNSSLRASIFTFTTNQGVIDFSGTNLSFYNSTSNLSATSGAFAFGGDSFFQTTGNQLFFSINMTFVPTSGTATFASLNLSPGINQTGGANGITRGLYVNPSLTSAADWRSIEWSNNSGWGLYGAGTANNYLGGNLTIGQTTSALQSGGTGVTIYGASASEIKFLNSTTGTSATDGTALVATGNTFTINNREVGDLTFGTSNLERMRLTAAGRLLLGTTTESTFLLDVNGTARVSGASTFARITATTSGIELDYNSGILYHAGGSGSYYQYIDGVSYTFRSRTATGSLIFATQDIERMRITSGGNLLVGTTNDIASSKVTISSTTQGFLPPRMTNAQRTAISSPAVGLMVYQTDSTEGTYEYISSGWRIINGGGGGGSVDELQVALISQVYG